MPKRDNVLGHENDEFRGQYMAMYDVGEGQEKKKKCGKICGCRIRQFPQNG